MTSIHPSKDVPALHAYFSVRFVLSFDRNNNNRRVCMGFDDACVYADRFRGVNVFSRYKNNCYYGIKIIVIIIGVGKQHTCAQ